MGYQYTQDKMQKFFSDNKGYFGDYVFSQRLRGYFDVDNTYLLTKMQMMFFPFKSRKIQFSRTSGGLSSLEETNLTSSKSNYYQARLGFLCRPQSKTPRSRTSTSPWCLYSALCSWVASLLSWPTRAVSTPRTFRPIWPTVCSLVSSRCFWPNAASCWVWTSALIFSSVWRFARINMQGRQFGVFC